MEMPCTSFCLIQGSNERVNKHESTWFCDSSPEHGGPRVTHCSTQGFLLQKEVLVSVVDLIQYLLWAVGNNRFYDAGEFIYFGL